jgi:hypothetical protein
MVISIFTDVKSLGVEMVDTFDPINHGSGRLGILGGGENFGRDIVDTVLRTRSGMLTPVRKLGIII